MLKKVRIKSSVESFFSFAKLKIKKIKTIFKKQKQNVFQKMFLRFVF